MKGRSRAGNVVTELAVLQEMARLLQILVRLSLQNMRGDHSQKEMVLLLDSVGCGHAEIAELLGVTPNSVGPALSRARRKVGKE
jgi:DNA-directed RNA polymerase specialized sigma24 family protein